MTTATTAATSGTSAAEAVLRTYLDALLRGDLDAIAASFAEDATWTVHGTLPLAGVRRGRAAIVGFLVSAGGLYRAGTQHFDFGDVTAQGDRVALEWRVTGIGEATGIPYDNTYCGIFVIRGGQIVEVREYFDTLHVAETLYSARHSDT